MAFAALRLPASPLRSVAERVSDVVKEILAIDKSDRVFDGRLDGHGKPKK